MPDIHPSAVVDPKAELASTVKVGPFSVIGPHVVLEDDVVIHPHVVVTGRTRIGARSSVHPFASLGQPGQIYKKTVEEGRLEIGAGCEVREYVTMNCGSHLGDFVTRVGDDCMFMAGSHVAHDCAVGRGVIFANNAVIGGHVTVGDFSFLGGLCAVHQRCRIGEYAMLSGLAGVRADIIPFGFAIGSPSHLAGLNLVGLKRRGFTRAQINALRLAYDMIFKTDGIFAERVSSAEADLGGEAVVGRIIEFIRTGEDRPLCLPLADN